ncbi:MAG: LacI family DNA-binding transcriptional regulator [bacterium]|nr:LacI family DNA-binding transcriptional regulator [bacterium]
MKRPGVRLRDIAEEAGVSISTVSLVLNDKALDGNVRISEPTIQYVQRIAREMNYFPNLSARAMLSGRTTIVGLILIEIKYSSSQLPLVQGISEILKQEHYSLATGILTEGDLNLELEEMRVMIQKGFDCLIVEPSEALLEQVADTPEFYNHSDRIILINRPSVAGLASVKVDNEAGGYLATRHLLELGHRRIAFGGDHCSVDEAYIRSLLSSTLDRFRGYLRAMDEFEADPIAVEDAREVVDLLPQGVTAAYCSRSWGAVDLLGVCLDRGIRVPETLAIIGQDDAREKRVVRPRISTVNMRTQEVGRLAARMALEVIEGEIPESVVLEPELIVRESTQV